MELNKTIQKTPHAAVVVFNYKKRLGSENSLESDINDVENVIISTVSLLDIQTQKTKGVPVGEFRITLAPTKNWVSALTDGSWIAILMSQSPITADDLPPSGKAKIDKLKMIGKITSTRVAVNVDQTTGARSTVYYVEGVDWGCVFDNSVYIDPFVGTNNNLIGSLMYTAFYELFPEGFVNNVTSNLVNILKILGKTLNKEIEDAADNVNRIAKLDYDLVFPLAMQTFLQLKKSKIGESIKLVTGKLSGYDKYEDVKESFGIVKWTDFIGTNTFWQLLIANSNPVLNEMINDIRWENDKPYLTLYNRIKPFVFQKTSVVQKKLNALVSKDVKNISTLDTTPLNSQEITEKTSKMISPFQNVRCVKIPLEEVVNVNAGTNWRDKYNFVEAKSDAPEYEGMAPWQKTVSQTSDREAFKREGFRPIIMSSLQFPAKDNGNGDYQIEVYGFIGWKFLLREWYFNTHRLLNGTLTLIGQSNYIQIGDNVMIDVRVLGPTLNISSSTLKQNDIFLLLHVESIRHSFSVTEDGKRIFRTIVQFVRGIVVKDDTQKSIVGDGMLDNLNDIVNKTGDADNLQNIIVSEKDR
jgi:hypothetical protein